jgi:hypothetical protein
MTKHYGEQYNFQRVEKIEPDTATAYGDYINAKTTPQIHYTCLRFVHKLFADKNFNTFTNTSEESFLTSKCNLEGLYSENAAFVLKNGFMDPTIRLAERIACAGAKMSKSMEPLYQMLAE